MNILLVTSGTLLVITAISHSVIGETRIIGPLQKMEGLPSVGGSSNQTKLTLRFAWHITSVLGIGIAIILFYFSRFVSLDGDQVIVIRSISITLFVCFIVSFIGSKMKHPSWIVFIIISLLTWIA